MDIFSAVGGAVIALALGGGLNEGPVITSERPEGCVVQVEGSNYFVKTQFARENPVACGYVPVDFTDEEFVPKLPEPEPEPPVETVQIVD